MDRQHEIIPAVASAEGRTEERLVEEARAEVARSDRSAWRIGELASEWTQRYSSGRTDADFGELIGMTRKQVADRRLVWERFGGKCPLRDKLSWTHHREALSWDDAEDWLSYAAHEGLSVAGLREFYQSHCDELEDLADDLAQEQTEADDDLYPPMDEYDEGDDTDPYDDEDDPDDEERVEAAEPAVSGYQATADPLAPVADLPARLVALSRAVKGCLQGWPDEDLGHAAEELRAMADCYDVRISQCKR